MNTLFLNPLTNDLCLDLAGNIAVATPPYAVAQDVASECKTFLGEAWYNTGAGIPYFQNVLGQQTPIAVLQGYLQMAALTVPTVVAAQAVITGSENRQITGQVQFSTSSGATLTVGF